MKLRVYILLFLLGFGLTPLLLAVLINLPLVIDRTTLFYQRAYLQNLRADFRDLDQHLASRHELIRLLAKLPEPSPLLGKTGDTDQIDLTRARYTAWVNQVLIDQEDLIQVLFVDEDGLERFWLVREARTQEWRPTSQPPQSPNQEFIAAGLALQPGVVMVSRIRVNSSAGMKDPRQLITLNLISRLGGRSGQEIHGAVILTIDVGGLAQFYRDTIWVNQDGSYLRSGQLANGKPEAFADFPGLNEIFAAGNLALWKGRQGQMLWVPMFLTEERTPLWVGRHVDSSPLDSFRDALILRVLSIILLLVLAVMIFARWIAARVEHFGQEVTGALDRILRDGQLLQFRWCGPREIHALGKQLTTLAATHAEHLRAAQAHTRELERSNRYKTQFLANVSHELRTPLNSILLLSKMLASESSGLTPAQRRQAQVIHEAGSDLRTLIDNILDISQIEAERIKLNPDWVEVPSMLHELLELVRPLLTDKPVELILYIDPQAPVKLYTDRDKLRQILKNFLSNAVKFTERGRIEVRVEVSPNPTHQVALHVIDTGIGIPQDKQKIIFEAFQQADGSTRRRYGGTGLGLTISRELAVMLGGMIVVDSIPGAGAKFSLLLPLILKANGVPSAPAPSQPSSLVLDAEVIPEEPAISAHAIASMTNNQWVFIIERDVKVLIQLTSLLNQYGLRVQTAANLDEAQETLAEESACCILILLAIELSNEIFEDLQNLWSHKHHSTPPVVILSAFPVNYLIKNLSESGRIYLLEKPIDRGQLNDLLIKILPKLLPP